MNFAFGRSLCRFARWLFDRLLLHDPKHALLREFAACHDVAALVGSHSGLVDLRRPAKLSRKGRLGPKHGFAYAFRRSGLAEKNHHV
jgi:hypothetical protein